MNQPNCYECKHRGTVPGAAHSSCNYPGNKTNPFEILFGISDNAEQAKKLEIKAKPRGVVSGWFYWPFDFDPVWLENCNGFERKETHVSEDPLK